jgi:hypothetical protein
VTSPDGMLPEGASLASDGIMRLLYRRDAMSG